MLLSSPKGWSSKPVNPDDLPPHPEPEEELRRVKRRRGRRHLANFENLPVTTHVYELSAEQRPVPAAASSARRSAPKRAGRSRYLPGHFERIHHVRKKYACPACETNGEQPQMETAAKPETAIDKGLAGPGLLAYIVTSKFSRLPSACTGWKISSRGRGSRSRAPRSRSGAAMWPIWSSRCMT